MIKITTRLAMIVKKFLSKIIKVYVKNVDKYDLGKVLPPTTI